uniref:Metallo-beta-lactamase domain-containing protein 1 n=1 Tax=Strigamia maritima TaxID=126957 RepID=T1JM42_STRMM
MSYQVAVLKEGYSRIVNGTVLARGTSTLIKGPKNILVDTLSPWDKDVLIKALQKHELKCEDIAYVVCTHGHTDHIGNLNLFTKATHIIGYSVCHEDQYYIHPFEMNMPYVIDDQVEVIPTPGHTGSDVTVIVQTDALGIVAVVGDLFEREDDLDDPALWREIAGSENPKLQEKNRNMILRKAQYIIPGHGPMFKVTEEMKTEYPTEIEENVPSEGLKSA